MDKNVRTAVRRPYWLAVAIALTGALAMRTLPLWLSPLPFNPDGIHASRLAAAAITDGSFPLGRMATDDLLFTPFLATMGSILGVDPMHIGQPLSALVGALPGVLAVAVVRRIAARWGWPRRRVFAAALLAGLLLAVEGLYLHRSMATDEQTVGLLFVPLAAVTVARAYTTGRQAWYLATLPVLVALGPLHNLDAMVLALVLTVATILMFSREPARRVAPLAALTGVFWIYFVAYHVLVERFTSAAIVQQARLTEVPELVAAWIVFTLIGVVWILSTRLRTQKMLVSGLFAGLFALLVVNAVVPVFPGTPATDSLIVMGLLPLALPIAMAIHAAPETIRTRPEGLALGALLTAPFVLIGVALTASLTPVYLGTAYRTTTFLHFPVLVLAALGTSMTVSHLAHWSPASSLSVRRVLHLGLAMAVLVAAVASVPVAFGGLAVLNYKGVTTSAELGASSFAAEHAGGPWASDNHLVRVQPSDGISGSESSTYGWLRGTAAPPSCFVLGQQSWTTVGAQFFPAPPEQLSQAAYRQWRTTHSVVYHGGAGDPIIGVAPRGETC